MEKTSTELFITEESENHLRELKNGFLIHRFMKNELTIKKESIVI